MFNKSKDVVPKFAYDQRVKVVNGFYRGSVGRCFEYDEEKNVYRVTVRLVNGSDTSLWGVPESYLEAI